MGFAPGNPGSTSPNTRLPATHWSASNAGVDVHRPTWVIGTDDAEGYGFFWSLEVPEDDVTPGFAGCLESGFVDVRIRSMASREVKAYVTDAGDGHWESRGPAPFDPSEQSDGWFRFRVRVDAGNFPDECSNELGIGPHIPFRLNMANTGHGRSRFFDEGGYDWAVFRPLYRTVLWSSQQQAWTFGAWHQAKFVHSDEYNGPPELRPAQAIFGVPVGSECDSQAGCFIEVAQMLPYTKDDRDAFVDEVEQFCANTVHCKVYRGGANPWSSTQLAMGGLHGIWQELGTAEDNDFVFMEFAPFDLDQGATPETLPDNVILITAGVHYEPNTLFAAEGVVRELMASITSTGPVYPSVLFGDGTAANPPTSFAIVFGASPDNLSWATTHVAPWGDGQSWKLRPQCEWSWRFNDDPAHPMPLWWVEQQPAAYRTPDELPDEFLWNTGSWPFDFSANPIWPLTGNEGFDEYVLTPPCSENQGAGLYGACYVDSAGYYTGQPHDFSGGCLVRHNDDPESVALRQYFVSLAQSEKRLGRQVILHLDLHGDIAPHPDSWFAGPNVATRLPPPYGIWSFDGAVLESPLNLDFEDDIQAKVMELASNLVDDQKPYWTPLSTYFRPFEHWWGAESQFQSALLYRALHNYRVSPPFAPSPASPIGAYAPFVVVIELEETGLYRHTDDTYPYFENEPEGQDERPPLPPELAGSGIGDCEQGPFYKPTSEGGDDDMQFCVDGRIDTPWIYEQWGRSIVWAAREAFADYWLVVRPVTLYCDADGDAQHASTPTGSCNTAGVGCPVGDCITWPGDDCDDGDPAVGPGGIEVCDAVDNDCNGVTDDEDEVCGLEICHLRTVCAGANGCLAATDSDGDWLADVDEATWFGSPNDADTDDDGLPDGVEVCLANGGLCPKVNAADSDGDTLSDAAEAVLGTNLCEPDTDDDRLSDAEDPTPTIPGAPRAYLEDECRALGDFISSISYTLFYGATTLEKKSKRTMLASYAYTAANKLAGNLPNAVALAEEQLLALLLYVDGAGQPDDWMAPSSEKTAVYDETDLLLYLLAYL